MTGLHVATVVDSDAVGGAEVYAGRVLAGMPAGVRCSLVASEQVAAALPGTDRTVLVPLTRHAEHAPRTAAALAELDPDVVHVHLVDPASNRAALTAAVRQAPTVVTLHLQGDPGPESMHGLYRQVAAAIGPSAPITHQLAQLGVPAERVVHIRHGVPLPARPAPRRDALPLRVGAVGRLTPQKGFDVLLDAVARLRDRGHALQVLIAGHGRDAAALQRRAAGLPVEFLGRCHDVPALLRSLDVFCLPSRAEALSLALLEAVAHGLPCVSTTVGDTAEALDGAALLVPPSDAAALADALGRVLTDPGMREGLARQARARALRDFDVRRMAAQTADVLAATAARAPRRPLPAPR